MAELASAYQALLVAENMLQARRPPKQTAADEGERAIYWILRKLRGGTCPDLDFIFQEKSIWHSHDALKPLLLNDAWIVDARKRLLRVAKGQRTTLLRSIDTLIERFERLVPEDQQEVTAAVAADKQALQQLLLGAFELPGRNCHFDMCNTPTQPPNQFIDQNEWIELKKIGRSIIKLIKPNPAALKNVNTKGAFGIIIRQPSAADPTATRVVKLSAVAKKVNGHMFFDEEQAREIAADLRAFKMGEMPNVVKTFTVAIVELAVEEETRLAKMTVMEDLDGSLLGLLRREEDLENLAHSMVLQAATGLAALHTRGIMHRDLKVDNLLYKFDPVTGDFVLKIGDLGMSGTADDGLRCRPFPLYWPPEMLQDPNLPWDGPAEMFSFALVVIEIFKELSKKAELWLNFCDYAEQGRSDPRLTESEQQQQHDGLREFLMSREEQRRTAMDEYIDRPGERLVAPMTSLLLCCLDIEPKTRPSAANFVARMGKVPEHIFEAISEGDSERGSEERKGSSDGSSSPRESDDEEGQGKVSQGEESDDSQVIDDDDEEDGEQGDGEGEGGDEEEDKYDDL